MIWIQHMALYIDRFIKYTIIKALKIGKIRKGETLPLFYLMGYLPFIGYMKQLLYTWMTK